MRITHILFLLGLLGLTGCQGMMPRWSNPGSLNEQRARANLHDPYIDNSLGPPVESIRPREFEKPKAETIRTRVYQDSRQFGAY